MLQRDQAPVFPVSTAALSRQLKKKHGRVVTRDFQPFVEFQQCLERSKECSVLTEIPRFDVAFQMHWLHQGLFALVHWGFLII